MDMEEVSKRVFCQELIGVQQGNKRRGDCKLPAARMIRRRSSPFAQRKDDPSDEQTPVAGRSDLMLGNFEFASYSNRPQD
jgi:hypothetical protein